MDKKQYNNIINWTQQNQPETRTEDSLTAVRAVCNNMGVALPQGNLAQVAETLATDDYMYWHSCTQQEAQEAADNGIPTIGISEDSIVLLAATDEEQPVTTTATVMTLANNENNNVTNMVYYSYSCCTTCVEDDSESAIEEIHIISFNNVMHVGDYRNFQVLVKPEKPDSLRLVWNSSDSSVIAITDAGEAWARKVGKARLSVKTADGQHQDAIDVEVVYCGDDNYTDVTEHNMVLQNDGYYVCSKCGYRVKSPELEDSDILSLTDYLQVISAQLMYAHWVATANGKFPSIVADAKTRADGLISGIRRQSKYVNKYAYVDSNGFCHGPEPIEDFPAWIGYKTIGGADIMEYTGLTNFLHNSVMGYYVPKGLSLVKGVLDLITGQTHALDFLATVAEHFNFEYTSMVLSVASAVMGCTNSNVAKGDHLVIVTMGPQSGRFIFSPTGQLKMIKIVSLNPNL